MPTSGAIARPGGLRLLVSLMPTLYPSGGLGRSGDWLGGAGGLAAALVFYCSQHAGIKGSHAASGRASLNGTLQFVNKSLLL
jgi:hypothetical protein